MSLEQASDLSQIVGTLAVLASLVFVGLQIRQNTQSQKIVAVSSLAAAIAAINVPAMQSPALGEALAVAMRDWRGATREQRVLAHFFLFSYFKLAENAWYQHARGSLDGTQWRGWESMLRAFYHSPGIQAVWWPRRQRAYSPEFQAYLAHCEPPHADIGSLEDIFGPAPAEPAPLGAGQKP
ncbi:MAG: hypothetical protein HY054_12905 [Proteobacteria bacterium]|nr:hypothetical protein [Pseudomonadota bacterium]